jgi:hypothetical protein
MKQMSNKNAYIAETVRPKKVMEALKYLIKQPLYEQENVTISSTWEFDPSNEAFF